MIQTFDYHGAAEIPGGASFWTPRGSEDSEDGIGAFFRDTWALGRIARADASAVVALEAALIDLADSIAASPSGYESIAAAVESGDAEAVPIEVREGPYRDALEDAFADDGGALGGLELGVAGLSMVLAAIPGCWPAASCRAHDSESSWAPHPVVLFACDRFRAEAMVPFARDHRCGFGIDPERPDLLALGATSGRDLNSLAGALLAAGPAQFRRPRNAKRGKPATARSELLDQLYLALG